MGAQAGFEHLHAVPDSPQFLEPPGVSFVLLFVSFLPFFALVRRSEVHYLMHLLPLRQRRGVVRAAFCGKAHTILV